jgi:hypothetical protein
VFTEELGLFYYMRAPWAAVLDMVEMAFPSVGDGRSTIHGASLIPLLVLATS